MNNISHNKVEHLLDFISETQGLSDEEIKNDLVTAGVNIDGFLARVRQTVSKGKQARIRAKITRQKESDLRLKEQIRAEKTKEEKEN